MRIQWNMSFKLIMNNCYLSNNLYTHRNVIFFIVLGLIFFLTIFVKKIVLFNDVNNFSNKIRSRVGDLVNLKNSSFIVKELKFMIVRAPRNYQ